MVGFTGVRVTITGLALLVVVFKLLWEAVLFVLEGNAFFPSRTDAGLGLVFFTCGFAAGLAASFVVFFASTLLACVTFALGLLSVFALGFDGAIDNPITGTATKPTAATAAHFIQFFMATPLPKPICSAEKFLAPHRSRHGSWPGKWGCRPRSMRDHLRVYRAMGDNLSNIVWLWRDFLRIILPEVLESAM